MIELELNITLPVATAWSYLTKNEHLEKWWGKGVSLEPRFGGSFLEPWTDKKGKKHITMGTVTAIEEKTRLQLDWMDPGWIKPTRVEFLFSKTVDGTKIYLQHSGWDIFEEKERQKKVSEHEAGWRAILDNYKKYCTGGT